MARTVLWSEIALQDLEDAAAYIARESLHYAAAFVRRTLDAASSLADLPERGRVVPELGKTSVRELILKGYRLIYEISDDEVTILAFIHGARDLSLLRDREWQLRQE